MKVHHRCKWLEDEGKSHVQKTCERSFALSIRLQRTKTTGNVGGMLGRCCLGERNRDFPSPPHLSHAGNATSDDENRLETLDEYERDNVEN